MYVLGYVLKNTICDGRSKCEDCKSSLTQSSASLDAHGLILEKAYKDGCLIFPSETAFIFFKVVEGTFRANRHLIVPNSDIVDRLTNDLCATGIQEYQMGHVKCTSLILRRWFKARMHWWNKSINQPSNPAVKKFLENLRKKSANGSRSMKEHYSK